MGMTYCGPYADRINARHEHEGYADRLMPTGEFTGGEWSARYPHDAHVAFIAACGCGWRSTRQHPPTEDGEHDAEEEWDREHLQPLIDAEAAQHTIPATTLLTFIRQERQCIPAGQPTERGIGRIEALNRLEGLLNHFAQEGATRHGTAH